MTTTMMKTTTRTICKWSGDADDEYSWRDDGRRDEDTVTMTEDERRYINWYHHAQAHIQWRDDDVASPTASDAAPPPAAAANKKTKTHVPFMNLTKEERDKKSKLFNFGLCSDCDAGLDDESEFVCKPRPNAAPLMTCNACSAYYLNLAFMRVGCGEERGGCN